MLKNQSDDLPGLRLPKRVSFKETPEKNQATFEKIKVPKQSRKSSTQKNPPNKHQITALAEITLHSLLLRTVSVIDSLPPTIQPSSTPTASSDSEPSLLCKPTTEINSYDSQASTPDTDYSPTLLHILQKNHKGMMPKPKTNKLEMPSQTLTF